MINSDQPIFGSYNFSYDTAAPAITQGIIDSGTVIVFGKLLGYNPAIWPESQTAQLPIILTYILGSNADVDTWSALTTTGHLKINMTSSLNAYGSINSVHQFRYVVIPGTVKINATANGLREGRTEINSTGTISASVEASQLSYHEICAKYHIPE